MTLKKIKKKNKEDLLLIKGQSPKRKELRLQYQILQANPTHGKKPNPYIVHLISNPKTQPSKSANPHIRETSTLHFDRQGPLEVFT